MATKTRDIAPLVKGNTSKTKSLVNTNAINLIASNRNNTYLKSKVSSCPDKTQGKKPAPSTHLNIHHKQTINRRTSVDKPPSSLDNTISKNAPSSIDNRPPPPSSLGNTQGKKLASSIGDSNIHNKQTLARRRLSLDHKPPPSSFRDNSLQSKKLVPKSDANIHSKQTLTRRRLSLDHKLPLSSPLIKNRTSPNPREKILKPSLSISSKNPTSQKTLLNKLSKIPHTSSKDVIGKQHSVGLYTRAVSINKTITKKQDSLAGLTSNLTDIVENTDTHEEGEELVKEEHQELVIEDHEELSEIVNIDEYLKAGESSSLYVVENQEVIEMEAPEEQLLVEETSIIKNHEELEEIKNLDLEETEKEESVMIAQNENQEEKKEDEESEILLKALDGCQQEKEEGQEFDLNIDQEEKEENEGRTSTTMAFAKAYPHLVERNNKKESVVSNDVIEETASKLREQRKNRVKALASAFETVISMQDLK